MWSVLISALATPLIAEPFVRHWQRSRKQLEIKRQLVADISDCLITLLVHVKHHRLWLAPDILDDVGGARDELAEARFRSIYQTFDTNRWKVETKLQVYFPRLASGRNLSEDWS